MKKTLTLAFAATLVVILAGCGGGGGGDAGPSRPPPPRPTTYGGTAHVVASQCAYVVGTISTGYASSSSARTAAFQRCESEAARQAGGAARRSCVSGFFSECAAIAAGENASRACQSVGRHANTLSAARQAAVQDCQSRLASSGACRVIASGCASGSAPPTGVWKPSQGPPPPPSSVAVFNITDACNDGLDFQYRFFEYTRWLSGNTVAGDTAVGQWPGGSRVYVTSGLGQRSRDHRLSCTPGRGVCFGAAPRDTSSRNYWGAGIDGDENCTNCCVRCPTSGDATFSRGRLTC